MSITRKIIFINDDDDDNNVDVHDINHAIIQDIILKCYLSVPFASPTAKLTKVRVGQVGFLPRQDSLIIDDDDNYDYNDDDGDDDCDDGNYFMAPT